MELYSFALSTIVLLASLGSGPAPTGTLRGVVRDPSGAVIPGAAILVQHWKRATSTSRPAPSIEPYVYADPQGSFSVHLAPGGYDVFISYPAFSPSAKEVIIEPSKVTPLDCELVISPLARLIY
jgi:hypothetical protein